MQQSGFFPSLDFILTGQYKLFMSAKNKILTAAGELFLVQGYNGTSADQIIEKAKVAKGSFFYNFRTKLGLARTVVRHFYDVQIRVCLVNSLSQNLSSSKKIIHFLKEVRKALHEANYIGGCLLANFSLELSDTENEVREEMKAIYDDWRSLMRPVIKDALGNQKSRVDDLVEFIITSVQGITLTSKVHKDSKRVDRDFKFLIQIIEKEIGENN